MPRFAGLFFGLIAALGFAISTVVHVSALAGVDVEARMPQVMWLHFGLFVPFFAMVLAARFGSAQPLDMGKDFLKANFPPWANIAASVLMGYVVLNFIAAMFQLSEGSPAMHEGAYALMDHGRFVRPLGEAEYHALRAAQTRMFSGHWLIFYAVPALFFLVRRPAGDAGT